MPQTLTVLEGERTRLLQEISKLDDFRSGSITAVLRRCGKPNCHCARSEDPGHGPDFRLTYKLQGKTVTETLSAPAALRKAQTEVAEFRKFQELTRAFVEVNGKICRLRPRQSTEGDRERSAQEKKRRKRFSGR